MLRSRSIASSALYFHYGNMERALERLAAPWPGKSLHSILTENKKQATHQRSEILCFIFRFCLISLLPFPDEKKKDIESSRTARRPVKSGEGSNTTRTLERGIRCLPYPASRCRDRCSGCVRVKKKTGKGRHRNASKRITNMPKKRPRNRSPPGQAPPSRRPTPLV